jgi:hypothetical protein
MSTQCRSDEKLFFKNADSMSILGFANVANVANITGIAGVADIAGVERANNIAPVVFF